MRLAKRQRPSFIGEDPATRCARLSHSRTRNREWRRDSRLRSVCFFFRHDTLRCALKGNFGLSWRRPFAKRTRARARAKQKNRVKGRALGDSPANEKKGKARSRRAGPPRWEDEWSARKPVSEPSKRLAARWRTDAGRQTDATMLDRGAGPPSDRPRTPASSGGRPGGAFSPPGLRLYK